MTSDQRQAVDIMRQLIWWFYRDLKTGYVMLDRLLARLHRRKHDLVRVLDRPEIPLHSNGSENDIRAFVTKRKISGEPSVRQARTPATSCSA
ncbi:transposase [Mesorhizobium australicum]|uniref:IS66 family transposase n=1 Tax=Mesorhizobium australicum TaxID=536018 RepID=UPI00333D2D01